MGDKNEKKGEGGNKQIQDYSPIFPAIRMSLFCVINSPKQLFLASLPCHNVLTHYVFPNTFGMLGFPSESQDLRGWKQNLNTVRSLQMCSNFNTQWNIQLPWDPIIWQEINLFLFLTIIYLLFNFPSVTLLLFVQLSSVGHTHSLLRGTKL